MLVDRNPVPTVVPAERTSSTSRSAVAGRSCIRHELERQGADVTGLGLDVERSVGTDELVLPRVEVRAASRRYRSMLSCGRPSTSAMHAIVAAERCR